MLEDKSNNTALDAAGLIQKIKQQKKQIYDLQQSSSWRITAPLRWVGHVAKRFLSKNLPEDTGAAPVLKNYEEWIRNFDNLSAEVCSNLIDQVNSLAHVPLFSVLLPLNTSNINGLRETIDSLRQQLYSHWELCIVIGSEVSADIHALLVDYVQMESRIKITTSQTIDLALLSNQALAMVSDQSAWLMRLNAGFLIAPQTMNMAASAINEHENSQIIYTDEDILDAVGQRTQPNFKPDWNLEFHHSRNLIGCTGIYRTALIKEVGGYQVGMSEAMDFDLSLRCIELIQPNQILHLPYVLFHVASSCANTSEFGVMALATHFSRLGIDARVENIVYGYRIHYALPKTLPWVSLIIPTRNSLDLLRMCIESVQQKTNYANFEIIVVDNGSEEYDTLAYLNLLEKKENIRILRIAAPFNYSALNNAAVKIARGDLIALMNNDIEVITPNWLNEMVSHALRPGVGVVGARLWFPDDTLQHGGMVLGLGGVAGHAHMGLPRGQLGYQGRASLVQSVSAVTAACLVVKKSIFEAVGGLNEQDLTVAFNDVDLCLRVKEAGYHNIWTPFAELYHHESASRGYENTPEKQRRLSKEKAYMHMRWGALLQADSAYSPNLTLQAGDFSLAWPTRAPTLVKAISQQPGQVSLSERLAQLAKAQVRIAYFAENVHSSTFRYRAANMVAVLNEAIATGPLQTSAACFFSDDLYYAAQLVKNADVLVISRARYAPSLEALVQAFKEQGKCVLFDVDDLVFDPQVIDLIIRTAGQKASDEVLNYWYSVVGRMAQMLAMCDGAITTNEYLAEKIKQSTARPVSIIPNFVNAAQLAISEPLYQRKLNRAHMPRERIKLGYFSGSASHNGDLSLISHALELVMATDLRVYLVLVGHIDIEQAFGARFGGYLKGHLSDRVTIYPFVDFLKLQELIAEVDFNLVPLQLNDFTNCKSELKYVDAAIVGTRTIASPSYAYSRVIQHGLNGYLAQEGQWDVVLLQAIADRDSNSDIYTRMAASAYQDVGNRFTWKTQRPAILQALGFGL